MKKKLFYGFLLLSMMSCSDDTYLSQENSNIPSTQTRSTNKSEYLYSFASILSKVVYERKDVRTFLKEEAIKQFDKNYDVLYLLIKDKEISGESFRDILISYSTKENIENIENNVPLLNILIPEIPFFDIRAENLDINNKEVPVVISLDDRTSILFNGTLSVDLEKGEVPDFHVFVVNENSRVSVPSNDILTTRSSDKTISFKSSNFDGTIDEDSNPKLRNVQEVGVNIGSKAIDAFFQFNKDDGSTSQMAFQRDYIYYGITPSKPSGTLNRSVSEYISYFEVNPSAFFKISDDTNNPTLTYGDPSIVNSTVVQEKRTLTEQELIDRMWTKGAFDFRFEITRSTDNFVQVVYIPAKPNELWNFNIDHKREHGTFFKSSKNTYKIDPNKFTSKKIYLADKMISLPKWDISQEALYRYITVLEEDQGSDKTFTQEYETAYVLSNKFNGDAKLSIGLGDSKNISGGITNEVNTSNSKKEKKTVTITRKETSDHLGSIMIYFYDPIITKLILPQGPNPLGFYYEMKTYNTGYVTLGLAVK